jgi:YD repeat-containing protein
MMTTLMRNAIQVSCLALILLLGSGIVSTAYSVTYTYDSVGRLIKASYGGGKTIEYTYDPAGNILSTKMSAPENTLRVFISPPGTGSVSGAGIACPSDCVEPYSETPDVTLTAVAEPGFEFLGWGGDGSGLSNPTAVAMNADKSVIAYFGAEDDATDTDGIPDTAEMGPGGSDFLYDGDGNGVADYQEAGVASLPTVAGGAYATIAVPPGLTLSDVRAIPNPSPLDTPAHLGFPYGFFEFTVNNLAPGGCTAVTVYLTPKYPGLTTYYKYGPTPDNTTPHWYPFLRSGSTGAQIVHEGDRTRIELAFCDGQRGDDVVDQDGRVIDQGGPVVMQYTLQVNRTGTGTGTVTSDIPGIDCGSDCVENCDIYTSLTLTAAADLGSRFTGWSGGGCISTMPCNLNMTGDRTVTASFAVTHTITVSAGAGGSISPPGPTVIVDHGTNKTFDINPYTGYHVKDVLVDGASVGAVTSYTFENVVADHTVSATFEINTYTIEATAGPNGKIEPSGTLTVTHDGSQSFTITADEGYHADVLVDGISVGSRSTYTFSSVSASHTIHADFLAGLYIVDLPKTGQSRSLAAGDDGMVQAGISWPAPRFTNPDGTVPISGDAVSDQLTGLMWTKDGRAPGPAECSPGVSKTWSAALSYISCLNTSNYLGYDDWRMPNVIELESLGHGGEADIAAWLNSQGFSNVQAGLYWSSTTKIGGTTNARSVNLQGGSVPVSVKTTAQDVWPVRETTLPPAQLWRTGQTTSYGTRDDGNLRQGAIWPVPRFRYGTGGESECMIDMLTGLMWPRSPDTTKRTWQGALDYVRTLDLCGHTDWRLSNRKELLSLINFGQSNPASWLNSGYFTGVQGDKYWSSTTTADTDADAWTVNLGSAEVVESAKDAAWYVFSVRGGSSVTVSPVSPPEGTLGTELTIRGEDFGTKKGKVSVGSVAAKVLTWQSDTITCLLSKVPAPGVCDVVIQRKEPKGAEPIIEAKAFEVKIPEITTEGLHGPPLANLTLVGYFFGTKKGKVALEIGGKLKSCKVTEWWMEPGTGQSRVKFIVPKGLGAGTYPLTLINKVGTATIDFAVE